MVTQGVVILALALAGAEFFVGSAVQFFSAFQAMGLFGILVHFVRFSSNIAVTQKKYKEPKKSYNGNCCCFCGEDSFLLNNLRFIFYQTAGFL